MAGAEAVGDLRIIPGALVDILDHEADGRTRRLPLEHAGEDAHAVRLAALCRKAGLAGPALVEPDLEVVLGERNPGRAAVHDAADRRPVALAPGGEAKGLPEPVGGHQPYFGLKLASRSDVSPARCGFIMPTVW